MDFFKSVFSNDLDSSNPPQQTQYPHNPKDEEDEQGEEEDEETPDNPNPKPNPTPPSGGGGGAWNFGGLIKTFASKSEYVIQTYRRDLEEFSSGLKKETEVIKEVATRAVRDLPGSLEVGASVAQESLESVGQAIDDFGGSVWRGTAEIMSHGKESLLSRDYDANSPDPYSSDPLIQNPNSSSKRYSRFEVQVFAIQNDSNTFTEEPEDGEDFKKWKIGFKLEEKEEEIENLLYENGALEDSFEKFVPDVVDRYTFWSRYFYRVYKLKQAEDARANLVKRVISREEEELSWEVDDDDDEEEENKEGIKEVKEVEEENKEGKEEEKTIKKEIVETSVSIEEKKSTEEATKKEIVETSEKSTDDSVNKEIVETSRSVEEKKPTKASQVENLEEADNANSSGDDLTSKADDKMPPEAKSEPGESCKDSDFSVVSSQPLMQEEDDLGWDEIEDLGEHDDKKLGGSSGSPNRMDLRKRLSAVEEDEDLSWDIEDDDDEPTKP